MMPRPFSQAEHGFSAIELLVAVLVFALGVLALLRLQTTAVRLSTDASQRAEAAFLAEQLVARMLISDPATAASVSHRPLGSTPCAPTGFASTHPMVVDWLSQVIATFPRAAADEQQVIVTGTPPSEVTVRLCWRASEVSPPHTLEVVNRVQWP